jgi:hypothetical protein
MTDYIPVLCCSKSKKSDIFSYNNKRINFVALPEVAPKNGDDVLYCTPDDNIPDLAKKWRDLIDEQTHEDLMCAFKLYNNEVYRSLYKKFGEHFYILSAGWGIIRSTYKLPAYNITYSKHGDNLTRRTNDMQWNDFNHLQDDADKGKIPSDAKIVLFAGPDYLNQFYTLTSKIKNTKIIFYKSEGIDRRNGYIYEHYDDNIRTNWFYKAAHDFKRE